MIKTFADKRAKTVWNRRFSKKLPQDIQKAARRKLIMLNAASRKEDLLIPPSNQFQEYCGKKKLDKYSIRINDQWRICFHFEDGDAFDVEIVDYH